MVKYIKFKKVKTEDTVLEFVSGGEDVKVNYFSEPIVSILADDEDKIDALIDKQPQEIECEEVSKEDFKAIFEQTLQYERICERADEYLNKLVKDITKKYPLTERETWNIQVEQAKKYKETNDENDAPFIKILADAEGATIADFADAVLEKANAFQEYSANILAQKRAFKKGLLKEIGL